MPRPSASLAKSNTSAARSVRPAELGYREGAVNVEPVKRLSPPPEPASVARGCSCFSEYGGAAVLSSFFAPSRIASFSFVTPIAYVEVEDDERRRKAIVSRTAAIHANPAAETMRRMVVAGSILRTPRTLSKSIIIVDNSTGGVVRNHHEAGVSVARSLFFVFFPWVLGSPAPTESPSPSPAPRAAPGAFFSFLTLTLPSLPARYRRAFVRGVVSTLGGGTLSWLLRRHRGFLLLHFSFSSSTNVFFQFHPNTGTVQVYFIISLLV